MFEGMKAAPTANAITRKPTLFRQPWPRESLPDKSLQYLSALRKSDCRAPSASSAIAFSFYNKKERERE